MIQNRSVSDKSLNRKKLHRAQGGLASRRSLSPLNARLRPEPVVKNRRNFINKSFPFRLSTSVLRLCLPSSVFFRRQQQRRQRPRLFSWPSFSRFVHPLAVRDRGGGYQTARTTTGCELRRWARSSPRRRRVCVEGGLR